MKIMIINGPNLNLLGIRDNNVYGDKSYDYICDYIRSKFDDDFTFFQSNSEGEIIDCIHKSLFDKYDGVVINAAGYSHTSVSIADAIECISQYIPVIEVHISNIYAREDFRNKSFISKFCKGVISGFGINSYLLAIHALKEN